MDQIYNKYSILGLLVGLSSGIFGVYFLLSQVIASALIIEVSLQNIRLLNIKKAHISVSFLVIQLGFEPRTPSLKGMCSTN
jgi:hypothetical protein